MSKHWAVKYRDTRKRYRTMYIWAETLAAAVSRMEHYCTVMKWMMVRSGVEKGRL